MKSANFFWIYVLFVVYVDAANVTQEERGKFEDQVLPGPISEAIMHPTR